MKNLKKLILVYIIFVAIKSILSYFISSPTMFADEYLYSQLAKSIFDNFSLNLNNAPSDWGMVLYPAILSIGYFFKNITNTYLVFKIINSFLSSLIIFPAYFLAKEFLSSKKSLYLAILISVIPLSFVFAPYILSENLYYPLFLSTIYFIYKSFTNLNIKWDILAGIFLGLTFLTRIWAIVIIPPILILTLLKFKSQIKKKLIWFLPAASIFILPWFIRNILRFGNIFGYSTEYGDLQSYFYSSLGSYFLWIFIYLSYITLVLGFIFFVIPIFTKKDTKIKPFFGLSLLILFFLIVLSAINAVSTYLQIPFFQIGLIRGRLVGRHIDCILPLFLISGLYIKSKNLQFNKNRYFFLSIPLSIIGLWILNYSLFPISNSMLSYLGVINRYLGKIIAGLVILSLPFLSYHLYKKLTFKKLVGLFIIFFSVLSLLNFSINFYNAKYEWDIEQMQIGKSFNKNNPEISNILFDKDDQIYENIQSLPKQQPTIRAAFWMNDKITVGDINNYNQFDYVITTKKMPLPLVNWPEIPNNQIFVYQIKTSLFSSADL